MLKFGMLKHILNKYLWIVILLLVSLTISLNFLGGGIKLYLAGFSIVFSTLLTYVLEEYKISKKKENTRIFMYQCLIGSIGYSVVICLKYGFSIQGILLGILIGFFVAFTMPLMKYIIRLSSI